MAGWSTEWRWVDNYNGTGRPAFVVGLSECALHDSSSKPKAARAISFTMWPCSPRLRFCRIPLDADTRRLWIF